MMKNLLGGYTFIDMRSVETKTSHTIPGLYGEVKKKIDSTDKPLMIHNFVYNGESINDTMITNVEEGEASAIVLTIGTSYKLTIATNSAFTAEAYSSGSEPTVEPFEIDFNGVGGATGIELGVEFEVSDALMTTIRNAAIAANAADKPILLKKLKLYDSYICDIIRTDTQYINRTNIQIDSQDPDTINIDVDCYGNNIYRFNFYNDGVSYKGLVQRVYRSVTQVARIFNEQMTSFDFDLTVLTEATVEPTGVQNIDTYDLVEMWSGSVMLPNSEVCVIKNVIIPIMRANYQLMSANDLNYYPVDLVSTNGNIHKMLFCAKIENELNPGTGLYEAKLKIYGKQDPNSLYSTTEISTGKVWANGEPIYRKVVPLTFPTVAGNIAYTDVDYGVSSIISLRGKAVMLSGSGITLPFDDGDPTHIKCDLVASTDSANNNKLSIGLRTANETVQYADATIEYTKATVTP